MLGDEYRVLISRRKLLTGIKAHTQRGHMCPQIQGGGHEFFAGPGLSKRRVGNGTAMTIRITEMTPDLIQPVQFIRRDIVS